MTIGNILKPWTFTNNVEKADATKVNADFDVVFSGVNDVINSVNSASGSRASLSERLGVILNDDGTLKAGALPIGTYDVRAKRTVTTNDIVTEFDSIIRADASGGAINITLPSAVSALVCPVIVCKSSSGNPVTIAAQAGETVMGLDSVALSNGGESIQLAADGVNNWDRIG